MLADFCLCNQSIPHRYARLAQRDERIKRNRAVMAQLGLEAAAQNLARHFTKDSSRRPTTRKKLAVSNPAVARRSTRSSLPLPAQAASPEGGTSQTPNSELAARADVSDA